MARKDSALKRIHQIPDGPSRFRKPARSASVFQFQQAAVDKLLQQQHKKTKERGTLPEQPKVVKLDKSPEMVARRFEKIEELIALGLKRSDQVLACDVLGKDHLGFISRIDRYGFFNMRGCERRQFDPLRFV